MCKGTAPCRLHLHLHLDSFHIACNVQGNPLSFPHVQGDRSLPHLHLHLDSDTVHLDRGPRVVIASWDL